MSTISQIYATVSGQQNVTWSGFAIGSTVQINLTCLDPANQSQPLDLAGLAVVMTWASIDTRGQPVRPVVISRQATITSEATGLCYVPIASGDTCPVVSSVVTPLSPGYYDVDLWAEDVDGNRLDLGFGQMFLSTAVRLPGDPITPLPSQEPIAQGFPGNPRFVPTSVKVTNYTAAYNDLVRCDPTASGFTVTMPAASAAIAGERDWICVKGFSDSDNAITVSFSGDTIDGATGPYFLVGRERLTVVSDGVSDWMVI